MASLVQVRCGSQVWITVSPGARLQPALQECSNLLERFESTPGQGRLPFDLVMVSIGASGAYAAPFAALAESFFAPRPDCTAIAIMTRDSAPSYIVVHTKDPKEYPLGSRHHAMGF